MIPGYGFVAGWAVLQGEEVAFWVYLVKAVELSHGIRVSSLAWLLMVVVDLRRGRQVLSLPTIRGDEVDVGKSSLDRPCLLTSKVDVGNAGRFSGWWLVFLCAQV